ncbi:hypothetical protein D3C76_1258140 [compost metagenome]
MKKFGWKLSQLISRRLVTFASRLAPPTVNTRWSPSLSFRLSATLPSTDTPGISSGGCCGHQLPAVIVLPSGRSAAQVRLRSRWMARSPADSLVTICCTGSPLMLISRPGTTGYSGADFADNAIRRSVNACLSAGRMFRAK